jgi:hypothetical protein
MPGKTRCREKPTKPHPGLTKCDLVSFPDDGRRAARYETTNLGEKATAYAVGPDFITNRSCRFFCQQSSLCSVQTGSSCP